ncbi:MAG: protein translocase subunit SecD [Coriobacteriales bacterium]
MAEKKKGAPELTEAQKEKARAQLQRQKDKVAKKSQRQEAKAAKDAERYQKRVAAERKRAAEARAQEAANAADPQYQAKKAAELARQKEKGRREMEKARKRSAKKAELAAKSREKEAAKAAKAQAKGGLSAAAAPAGAKAERKPKRKRTNLIAIVAICVIALAAAVMLYPPQDKITQGLDIQGGVSVNLSASTLDGSDVTQEQMDEAQNVITSRVNASGASAASVQQQGSNSFLVQVPGAEDAQSIIDTLSTTGVLEFVRVDAIEDDELVQLIESGITGMNLKDEGVAYDAFMTGESVTNVTVDRPEGSSDYAVNLSLDSQGTKDFGTVSSELVSTNGQIAILLDGKVECAPAVQSAITTGQVQITGNYTAQEANDLKAIINSGSLPVSLTIDQSSIVGPTLGQNALWVGIVSALIGLALVMVWLILFYGGLGFITGLSVCLMAVVYLGLLALLSSFGWFSLTLPGIAGIIVNIGLSADSSILIMECFHEQVRNGRTVKAAAQGGAREGIFTSIDADVVTLVSALVLYFVAIGDVRGFGLTLALGIICDLLVMFLFSGPIVRMLGERQIAKHPGFWGMRDEINEGEFVAKEVR